MLVARGRAVLIVVVSCLGLGPVGCKREERTFLPRPASAEAVR